MSESQEETTLLKETTSIKDQLIEAFWFIVRFLREPWIRINSLPNWNWPQQLLAQVLVTAATGTVGGLFESALAVIGGVFIVPIISFVTISVSTLLLFYFIRLFAHKQVSYKRLWQLVFFANLPLFIFQIIAPLFPLISLIGLGATAYLLYLGLTGTYEIDERATKRLLTALFAIFALVWLWGHLDSIRLEKSFHGISNAPEVHLGK